MITVTNNEHKALFNEQQFEQDAQQIVSLMGYPDFDLGILLTDNQAIQKFNRDYRGKDEPTDILSFPFYPDLKSGEHIKAATEDDKNIGDLVISLEYITAPDYVVENTTLNQQLRTLLCHGICHLLGYDHYTEQTDKVMKEKETWLAEQLEKKYEH